MTDRIKALGRISEWLGYRAYQAWKRRTPELELKGARAAHAAAYVVFCEERAEVYGGSEYLRMSRPHQEALERVDAELREGVESLQQFLKNAPTVQLLAYADQKSVAP